MTITRLKAKNQVTLPREIVQKLRLRPYELFLVDVEGNYIKLTPVEAKPRYTADDIKAIDRIVHKEKRRAKTVAPGKEFSGYIKRLTK